MNPNPSLRSGDRASKTVPSQQPGRSPVSPAVAGPHSLTTNICSGFLWLPCQREGGDSISRGHT